MNHFLPNATSIPPQNRQNHSVPKDPPSVLIMRRDSIRTFPDGKRVAIYYIKDLDKYIPIAYSDNAWKPELGESYIETIRNNVINESESIMNFNDNTYQYLSLEDSEGVVDLYDQLNENNKNKLLSFMSENVNNLYEVLEFIRENIKHQTGSESTQVVTTTGTYSKTAKLLKDKIKDGGKVLDYGAGLGLGSDAMRDEFNGKVDIHSFEPEPRRWKGSVPVTHTKSSDIHDKYDAVVSHNVLNVLEPELRSHVTKDILSKVKVGGHVVIGTRKWSGDVNLAKNAKPGNEEKSLWISKKGGDVYQKGFDGNELLDHLKSHDPEGNFEFKKLPGISANGIIGHRIK